MYWLLPSQEQDDLRTQIEDLVTALSDIKDNPHADQLFPYVGRKDRRKAGVVVEKLTSEKAVVIEPFTGSGSILYAVAEKGRNYYANEWEPYACRMAAAPWRLPEKIELEAELKQLLAKSGKYFDYLYKTICVCGHVHVLDSLFFDRQPEEYFKVSKHERLGPKNENITYRGRHKCPNCGRTEKLFDKSDEKHLLELSKLPVNKIFNKKLIINSRINISPEFSIYGNLFPHRSKLALWFLWENIQSMSCPKVVRLFLEDAFLSILPQAKFKDYRSKSQDLHCPPIQLREVNLLYRFEDQVTFRFEGLSKYSFSKTPNDKSIETPISCFDYRDFFKTIKANVADLVFTDPPWCDGNAYFEKAQLYHPWLGINIADDVERLEKEFVVTNAPTRSDLHNFDRWWKDLDQFFEMSYKSLKEKRFLALYFRPIPAKSWLKNLNQLKLLARKNSFEPILTVDVGSSDPSMRIQQSAAYLFSSDIVFLFYRLPKNLAHVFEGNDDIDQLVYQVAENCQETQKGTFTYKQWRGEFAKELLSRKLINWNTPPKEEELLKLFNRYCDNQGNGNYLPKPNTPFSGQLFDTPAIERLFTYVPQVVEKLTNDEKIFSYDHFLLTLATFVENGTRALIGEIDKIDIRKLLDPYAVPIKGGRYFQKRPLPKLPKGIDNLLKMDPYKFEEFVAHLLVKQGYKNVATIGRSGDRGVDVVATDPNGLLTVVQCKRFINNVNATPIQRLHSFAITRGAKRKILVTTSDFTKQAKEEAESTETELISGKALELLISKYIQ